MIRDPVTPDNRLRGVYSNKCAGWLRELSGINEAKSHAVRESYSYFAAAPLVTGIMGELK